MPIHDWTRLDPEISHDFHLGWIAAVRSTLNQGLLPQSYYALIEQHAGRTIDDIVALPASDQIIATTLLARRRSVAIRHANGHRLIALIEIVSPANKDCARHVNELAEKSLGALKRGVNLMLLDLFPPGRHDPGGIHGAIRQGVEGSHEPYELPSERALTVATYVAGPQVEIYTEHLEVGSPLPLMALFLRPDRYVNIPLESMYEAAYRGTPAFYRDILEGKSPP